MFSASWIASPQPPSEGFTPNWSREGFWRQSLRQVVRLSAGGARMRVRLTNAYGTSPVRLAGASAGRTAAGAGVQPGSLTRLTFGGAGDASIPARGELVSDDIPLAVAAGESVTVTLYFDTATGPATFHAQAFTTSYRSQGDRSADAGGAGFDAATESWYFLSAVEVDAGRTDAVALFGDSITDGFGSTPGADRRWSDVLAERTGRPVLNAGIGGNLLLNDSAWYGERGVRRLRRDVLDRPGVDTLVVLLGLNDIGFSETDEQPTYKPAPVVEAEELIAGHRELIRQGRAAGLRVIGSTLLPFGGSDHWGEHAAKVSHELNEWIRCSGEYDAVADLNRALADPGDPDRLPPSYDFGDHLHPNGAGYEAMAEAVSPLL
ncbi:G-D-S-L family lipolytic protein [Streptomyces viridochromogenes]|uniref:G-D-S-L family lipolytic protein n=1 Tax=Streptomyces viridochromogenes TaxID=1938 RepID=A0A0J7YVR6_STRVR|nr:SGNH/GDSL hydrolase family protein [Streptomyces viridochromogenes]KMS67547.1 G-D-S-L family lipolytic protein [Streptomyces viridochromogenes]KOG24480.1 G-D-S-L family lipolytic protein [Streptomyces viridochromogenes]KOG28787.1 G-D-S-L family lipolytic protein [Streptomyces viridochromogenes]